MPDEPLSIEFANTRYAVRGEPREGIGTTGELTAWLSRHAERLGVEVGGVDQRTVEEFGALRDAVRGLVASTIDGARVDREQLATLNRAAAGAPRWPVLTADLVVSERTGSAAGAAALAAIARDAMRVLAGPLRAELRACRAPGCILFFVKDHPRREWCSAGCGNRARVARHYVRHRTGRS